jgi:hypothetical protein
LPQDLRRLLPQSAGPASPARLPVYPLRDGVIIGARAGGGENGRGDFYFWGVNRASDISSHHPRP